MEKVRVDEWSGLETRISSCTNCELSRTRTNALRGEGDRHARIMLVAQAPGKTEDIENRMFMGPTGPVLDELLESASLSRRDIYMTNLIKCHLPKNRRPKQREIDACRSFLLEEINNLSPEIIVPLGYYATRELLSGDMPKAGFKDITGRLVVAGGTKIYPLPHPSYLLYNRALTPEVTKLYEKLFILSKPCRWYPVCPMKRFTEMGILEGSWTNLYCLGDWSRCVRLRLENQGTCHPDWMLPDGSMAEHLKGR